MTKLPDTLYAFYDLEVNPNSFDIVKYVVLADLARREAGCDKMHILFVPGRQDGFRADDQFEQDNRLWRLRQIMLSVCSLIPACKGVTICSSREDAENIETELAQHIFPPGHSTANPVQLFDWAHVAVATVTGREVPSLQVAGQARKYVRTWIDEHAGGRQVVSITLREMGWEPERNSRVDDWLAFARGLDPTKYFPVILRDTDAIFLNTPDQFDGLCQFSEVVINLELRAAFYEECYLNVMVGNGPGDLCILNTKARYIIFFKFPDSARRRMEEAGLPANCLREAGIGPNGHFPFAGLHQRVYWTEDSLANIESAFSETVSIIDENDTEIEAFRSRETFPPSKMRELDMMMLLSQSSRMRQSEEIVERSIARGNYRKWYAELPTIIADYDIPPPGLQTLVVKLIDIGVCTAEGSKKALDIWVKDCHPDKVFLYRTLLGNICVATNNLDMAAEAYELAHTMQDDQLVLIVKLATVNLNLKNLARAQELLEAALDRGMSHPVLLELLAEVYKLKGDLKKSVEISMQLATSK